MLEENKNPVLSVLTGLGVGTGVGFLSNFISKIVMDWKDSEFKSAFYLPVNKKNMPSRAPYPKQPAGVYNFGDINPDYIVTY